jgi:hypothetical protein
MTRNDKRPEHSIGVRLSIWSVRNQLWLTGQVRIYIFAGTALIAFLALAGVISIETAMFSSLCGGLAIMGLIWILIQQRKAILLNIEAPEVREQAHHAMLAYLREVDPDAFAHEDTQPFRGKAPGGVS